MNENKRSVVVRPVLALLLSGLFAALSSAQLAFVDPPDIPGDPGTCDRRGRCLKGINDGMSVQVPAALNGLSLLKKCAACLTPAGRNQAIQQCVEQTKSNPEFIEGQCGSVVSDEEIAALCNQHIDAWCQGQTTQGSAQQCASGLNQQSAE